LTPLTLVSEHSSSDSKYLAMSYPDSSYIQLWLRKEKMSENLYRGAQV
jgi:hypothetical protein